jgi:Spy/CpxP family protein refolding chaperone
MLRIFGSLIIVILIASVISNAQPRRRTPAERAADLKEQLNLTDKQTAKIDSIYTISDTKFQDVMQNGFDRTKSRAIMDTTNAEISKLLTDKQKDAFNKLLEERRNRMRRNRPDNN